MKYGPFIVATVRPETKFGDSAIAVHPTDKRYSKWVGSEVEVEGLIGTFKIQVVADEVVDPKFGTGAVKVTPAHDFNDWDIAQRHNLPIKQVVGFDGRLNEQAGKYAGLKVAAARQQVVSDLKEKGLLVKVKEDYTHRVGTCYRCKRVLEPLPKEQWFVRVKPLADAAKKLVDDGKITVYPKRFTKQLNRILDNFIDWNISRQIVWGIRIPAFFNKEKNEWFIETNPKKQQQLLKDPNFEQDTDTFDTWFSSSQWPFATLQTISNDAYEHFYPTSVMETGHDILRAWISRMIMIGQYATGKEPFKTVFLHGMVRDRKGQKMSKSKGNVINPLEMIDIYGADALRAALIFGTKEGGDVSISEDKVRAMRNFANKIWNVGRFIKMNRTSYLVPSNSNEEKTSSQVTSNQSPSNEDTLKFLQKEFKIVKKKVIKNIEGYRFSMALEELYEFLWHRFADFYIEELKEPAQSGNIQVLDLLENVYLQTLTLLHPFVPFVTEAVWKEFRGSTKSILDENIN
jgi:valyl-tRNA synthetase